MSGTMAKTLALEELIEKMLERPGWVVLRNSEGTMELKGEDLTLKTHKDWITVYHGCCDNSESRSHLHLRKGSYRYACLVETEGYTPQMAFWLSEEDVSDSKPSMAFYFPSFYDWSNGKKDIVEHQKYCERWLAKNGRAFHLT